ncbi:Eco57I restriction-modification methylase domain-containing protein [Kineosporia succinea]|uniref:site-specific DNA-methyltransferase (adenine-specific) n=1 Tax=Kineosporia succinea TaxID=84632 RepID=A0ABT9P0U9_9ACTN|nr:N-6 DNA methylase [Kineosporia succinea]MDP9826303.1 adenine-specific DNA methylase [Kineosporia succinea]
MTTLGGRKARGAFFTPAPIARYVTRWALRGPGGRVLEPSSGEAAFLLAAAELGGDEWLLDGVELHPASARSARETLEATGVRASVTTADFFTLPPTGDYDAVIGNPPYVRYHDFTGADRDRAQAAARQAGVRLSGLSSSWAAFTVHAARFLRPGGRLGLVLPAELLSVNYAAPVRQYLLENFARVRLVAFTERVFPGVAAEILLVLADGFREPGGHLETLQVRNTADLDDLEAPFQPFTVSSPGDKWTPALIPAEPLRLFDRLLQGLFTTLDAWGRVSLGIVTGNNGYFALSTDQAAARGLGPADLLPLSPPGSSHLRGLDFSLPDREALGDDGAAVWLFRPGLRRSPAAVAYVRDGEDMGVDEAYKCRIRTPWWQVRLVPPPDLLLTYMNADAPRLVTNSARAHHLNSVHGVHLSDPSAAPLLSLAALGSVTLLGAETVGRSYGGGLLKLEPSEAKQLPLPSPAVLWAAAPALDEIRPAVATALSRYRLAEAVRLVDDVLLNGTLGLAPDEVEQLRAAHAHLQSRRRDRARTRL